MSFQEHSLVSCSICRTRKRKCDKRLPKCTLCLRKGLDCGYIQQSRRNQNAELLKHQSVFQQLSPASLLAPSLRVEESEAESPILSSAKPEQLIPNIDFPAVYFLDSRISRHYQVDIPKAGVRIPPYITEFIGDLCQVQKTSTIFFNTSHEWMPIVSKKRFQEHVNPFKPLRADYALLALCMNLITWHPSPDIQNPRTAMYLAAKRFHLELEIAGVLSIQVLQAGIFIALFELGHAIYPSAFLSAAACARYGSALGLDWRTGSPWKAPFSWVDAEEQNRVWWAVVLLDRVVNIGRSERPLLLPTPKDDIFVPGNDEAWDQGVMPSKPMYSLGSAPVEWLGSFALIAQATKLLGEVLRHISEPPPLNEEEAILLDRALKALLKVVGVERELQGVHLMNQHSICTGTLIMLHEAHASLKEKTPTSLYFEKIHQAKATIVDVKESLEERPHKPDHRHLSTCIIEASPFIAVLFYQLACPHLRIIQDTQSEESYEAVEIMKGVMRELGGRWKAASESD